MRLSVSKKAAHCNHELVVVKILSDFGSHDDDRIDDAPDADDDDNDVYSDGAKAFHVDVVDEGANSI